MDVEMSEDISELEAKLYAQVHHDGKESDALAIISNPVGQTVRIVTNATIINRSLQNSGTRYWNKDSSPMYAHKKRNFGSFGSKPSTTVENIPKNNNQIFTTPRPFKPYESYLSNTGVISNASQDRAQTQGSQSNLNKITIVTTNKKTNKRNISELNANNKHSGPFVRNIMKMNKAKKYEEEKIKGKQSRQKSRRRNIETIVLDSSEDDNDVIEIPVPPPPMVTIETSDESEIDVERLDTETFAKPQNVTKHGDQRQINSSRCASPSSILSDDFIGHFDRSRLLEESNIADDQDLQCLQQTVDSVINKKQVEAETSTERNNDVSVVFEIDKENFLTPYKSFDQTKSSTPNYQVTQSNFKAVDIYESESSDMLESIYAKGKRKATSTSQSSSSSEIEEIESVPKLKKLRKRKASGSNKGSEPNDCDSTDSEEDTTHSDILPPFISRGEAVENFKDKPKKRSHSVRNNANSSDNEFINMLSEIVQGKKNKDDVSEDCIESDENVTARELAEDVLQKQKKKKKIAENKSGSKNQNEISNKETEDALPGAVLTDLDSVLTRIDQMPLDQSESHKSEEDYDISEVTCLDSENESSKQFKVPVSKNKSDETIESHSNDLFTVVHSNSDNIGWNDEMIRFYERSWGGENFNVNRIRRAMMNNTSSKWTISNIDKFPRLCKKSNIKCNNCCEFGHIQSRCPHPRKPVVCYMCGEIGHRKPRCPNTICLRCGSKTRDFMRSCNFCSTQNKLICPICKIRGHSLQYCPDKWRRYHSTTVPNEPINNKVLYSDDKFCCICAKRDHLPEHCRNGIRFLDYAPSVTEIKSHVKSYEDSLIKTHFSKDVIGYNLLYKPDENVEFTFTNNLTNKQYYSRFLSSVGLLDSEKVRKRKLEEFKKQQNVNEEPKKKIKKQNFVFNPFAKKNETETQNDINQFARDIRSLQVTNPNQRSDKIELNLSKINNGKDIQKFVSPKVSDLPENVGNNSFPFTINLPKNSQSKDDNNISEICDTNEATIEDTQKIDPSVSMDSDSNYSFSEAFTNVPQNVNVRKLEPLPDYIPLTDSNEYQDNDDDIAVISHKYVSKINYDDSAEKWESNSETYCEAKIYLTRQHKKYLMSPDGNKFLVENSSKYNVKTKLNCTSVSHILIIEGFPKNQDKFHSELLNRLTEESRKPDQPQKVPRRREILIKLIQENILQLESNLGNITELFKKIDMPQNEISKIKFRASERARRILNMILIGQTGFKQGRDHLEALQNYLEQLQQDKFEFVPNALRNEIDEHWKYIFTSYNNENYEEMIGQYIRMKEKNQLPKLLLNYRLLGKCGVLDVNLTNEQKGKLSTNPETIEQNRVVKNVTQTTDENSTDTEKITMVFNPLSLQKNIPSIVNPSTNESDLDTNQKIDDLANTSTTRSDSQISKKLIVRIKWETICTNLYNEISGQENEVRSTVAIKQGKDASVFWSRECIKLIHRCIKMGKDNPVLLEKLNKIMEKAEKGLLSFNNHKALSNIFYNIKDKTI